MAKGERSLIPDDHGLVKPAPIEPAFVSEDSQDFAGDEPDFRPPAVQHSRALVPSSHTEQVVGLIQLAIDKGISPESLEKLLALQDRAIARQAEADFNRAKAAFQAECPVIGKNRDVDVKSGPKYRFADLEKITQTIRPLLERHGFTYSFSQSHAGDVVTVICHLKHEAGHQENTSFSGPWATNAGMSAIQKYAAATTFCQRYALRLALGLPVGEDDDGREPPPEYDPPDRTEGAPTAATRQERKVSPSVTGDEMGQLCRAWKLFMQLDAFNAGEFVSWVRKKLDPAPLLDPTDTKSWPAKLTRAQFDALLKEIP